MNLFIYFVCVFQKSEDNLWESVFSFCGVGLVDRTSVTRLGGKYIS